MRCYPPRFVDPISREPLSPCGQTLTLGIGSATLVCGRKDSYTSRGNPSGLPGSGTGAPRQMVCRVGMISRWQKAVSDNHGEVLPGPDHNHKFHASECIDQDSVPPNRKSSRPCVGDRSSWLDRQDPSLADQLHSTSSSIEWEKLRSPPGEQ